MTFRGFLAVLLLGTIAPAFGSPLFPAFTGPVVDEAGVVSPAVKQQISVQLTRYQKATGNQVVVVTLKSLGGYAIEEYGYQLGRQWGIGEKGKNNGVLLIVVPAERAARIEVGYGLEGTLTDALSHEILQRSVLPRLAAGAVDVAILAGTSDILATLESIGMNGGAPAAQGVSTPLQSVATEPQSDAVWIGLLVLALVVVVVGELIHRFMPERRRSGKIFGVLVGAIATGVLFNVTGGAGVFVAPAGGALLGWLGYRLHLLLGTIEEKYDATWDPDPEVRERKRREVAEAQARRPELSAWLRRKRGGSGNDGGGGSFGGGGASGKWN